MPALCGLMLLVCAGPACSRPAGTEARVQQAMSTLSADVSAREARFSKVAADHVSLYGQSALAGATTRSIEGDLLRAQTLLAAAETFARYVDELPVEVGRLLRDAGVGAQDLETRAQRCLKELSYERLREMAHDEHQLALLLRRRYDLLAQTAGQWQVGSGGRIAFELDDDMETYNGIQDQIETLRALLEQRRQSTPTGITID